MTFTLLRETTKLSMIILVSSATSRDPNLSGSLIGSPFRRIGKLKLMSLSSNKKMEMVSQKITLIISSQNLRTLSTLKNSWLFTMKLDRMMPTNQTKITLRLCSTLKLSTNLKKAKKTFINTFLLKFKMRNNGLNLI